VAHTIRSEGGSVRRFVVVGLAILTCILAVAVLMTALNWTRLSALYTRYANSLSALGSLQNSLEKKYEAEQVNLVMMRHSSVSGSILSISIINSSSLREIDPSGARESALEIATTVRNLLPPTEVYDNYKVTLAEQRGTGIKISKTVSFIFSASEIPPSNSR
jgi:hypothetical protein